VIFSNKIIITIILYDYQVFKIKYHNLNITNEFYFMWDPHTLFFNSHNIRSNYNLIFQFIFQHHHTNVPTHFYKHEINEFDSTTETFACYVTTILSTWKVGNQKTQFRSQ